MADENVTPLFDRAEAKRAKRRERDRKYKAKKRRQASPPASPPERPPVAKASPVIPSRRHLFGGAASDRLLGAVIGALGAALGGFGLIVDARYAASNGHTPFDAGLLAGFGAVVDGISITLLPGASALWRKRHRLWACAAAVVWIGATAYTLTATSGFVAANIGDTVAGRASTLDQAADSQAQRSQAIKIAKDAADAATQARVAECIKRGPRCRDREADERAALAELAKANALPVIAAPAISSPNPGADLIANVVHLDARTIQTVPSAVLMFAPAAAGLLLTFAGLL